MFAEGGGRLAKRMGRESGLIKLAWLSLSLWLALTTLSPAGQPPVGIDDREAQRRAEEERLRRREREESAPEARLPVPETPAAGRDYPVGESPSFLIREIRLEGESAEKFQWVLKAVEDARGRLLGSGGINLALAKAQSRLSAAGFTTSRVVVKPQDLKSGVSPSAILHLPKQVAALYGP
jgi:hemolysin activation/secretion protein